MTYKIIRHYQDYRKRTIKRGLTLEEAQAHCKDPKTRGGSWENGDAWFDGFTEE